jgi:uncharacterized membrane protein YbaN (DUF454 family)
MQERNWLSTAGITTVGSVLVLVGVAGIFLPVLPGVIPIAAGMTLLARRFAWADRVVANIRSRIPDRNSS